MFTNPIVLMRLLRIVAEEVQEEVGRDALIARSGQRPDREKVLPMRSSSLRRPLQRSHGGSA